MELRDLGPDGQSALERALGYLNFSAGTEDCQFLTSINQLYHWLEQRPLADESIATCHQLTGLMSAKLDELHGGGWKMLKIGVGRTKAFAEAFLKRRLDAVMVPEPAKGEAPRKAKVAKAWKDVRKHL